MYKKLLSLILIACLAACNNDKKVTVKSDDGTTTTYEADMETTANELEDMNKKMEELQKLTPLSLDELKALLPESIAGMSRSSFNAHSAMGYAMAQAEYEANDTTRMQLVLYDCAGEAGAGAYSLMYAARINMQSESDDGYYKTVEVDGQRMMEQYEKHDNTYKLTYLANDRIMVMLEGENTGRDAVVKTARDLKIKI